MKIIVEVPDDILSFKFVTTRREEGKPYEVYGPCKTFYGKELQSIIVRDEPCNVCKNIGFPDYNFCPNCGRRLRKDKEK